MVDYEKIHAAADHCQSSKYPDAANEVRQMMKEHRSLTAENRAMREAIQGVLDNCSPAFLGINVELSAFQELRKIAVSTQKEPESDE